MDDMKTLQNLKTIPYYLTVMRKLTVDPNSMTAEEKTYILACAIMLIKKYEKDKRYSSYVELAYYIILKYSLSVEDFEPLYDFAVNFGFYPIAQLITEGDLLPIDDIPTALVHNQIDNNYEKNGIVESFDQKATREKILAAENDDICYVAPTSFGKSSLIIEHIKTHWEQGKRVAIIVPTKSLLMQTYRTVKNENLDIKLLIHDEMYNDEEQFVAIFTQERALRLLDKHKDISFDMLYVDEAHRIFERDSRSVLLLRLIKQNRMRNQNAQVIYLSPLVSNTANLNYKESQNIFEQKIKFNIKEPEYYEYRKGGSVYKYNRFVDTFFEIGTCAGFWEYIHRNKTDKTFCYLYSPKKIEEFTGNLADSCETLLETDSLKEVINNLKKYVHEDFYAIDYIKKGIVYLHGKLPDSIKEYLEYKFSEIPEINFLVANRVVLEGMNFPIDSLFVLNGHNLTGKDLTNLIGRVNRLDKVFESPNTLYKLMPKIHFVNSDEYNRKDGKLENKIKQLKHSSFEDNVKNPLLQTFDITKEKNNDVKEKCKTIIKDEEDYFSISSDPIQKLKQQMIALGMNTIYSMSDDLCEMILYKIDAMKTRVERHDVHFLDKLRFVFVRNIDSFIIDEEFKRLKNDQAISYYKMYFENRKKSMREKVSLEVAYFERRKAGKDPYLFIGDSYGEVPYIKAGKRTGRNVYIDLGSKTTKELANYAIIKQKIEDDFVSYKLHKFFQLLYDYELLSKEEYHNIIYGTTDAKKLNLVKMGLTINLINRLEEDNQLENISVDNNSNLCINDSFEAYREGVDDFFRFELNKFL